MQGSDSLKSPPILISRYDDAMAERLQKIMARAGIASRRKAEELIARGRVRVNGVLAKLGDSAEETDSITVNGTPVMRGGAHVTFALNKPRGVVTTASDDLGRENVLELVPEVAGLHPVGRLDRESEGLLLLTTDGDLTLHLTHPRYEHEKEYRVWTDRDPTTKELSLLRNGVQLEDGPAKAVNLEKLEGGAMIVLREGRNRQVRRMFEAVGLEVLKLKRVRVGAQKLGDLRVAEWRVLEEWEVDRLRGVNPQSGATGRAKQTSGRSPARRARATQRD
jgi:23S rRNA pseudouridine2605 synthase